MIPVIAPFPPAIVNIGSKRYLVGGSHWQQVDDSFTLQDAAKLWSRPKREPAPKLQTFQVANSKGTGFYLVVVGPDGNSCTCTGFGFRRTCKHITNVLAELKLTEK